MAVIEEGPPHIPRGSSRKRTSRDTEKAHDQEEEAKKKKIIKKSEIIMSLTDLPSNVLVNILAKLPLRTLFDARSVCKTFNSITTHNPHFINHHSSSNAAQILVFQFWSSYTFSCLPCMADHELGYKKSLLKPPLFHLPKMGTTPKQYNVAYFIVNSCKGLLYLRKNGFVNDCRSLVCNPVTREYVLIPDVHPKMRSHWHTESLWLGYSPDTDQYKVLRIFRKVNGNPNEFAAQVYVIGSGSWRDIEDTPLCGRYFSWDLRQTLFNGLMYWHSQSWKNVVSFDFDREKFGEIVLPTVIQGEEFFTAKYETSIGVLGGCLCLTCNHFYDHRVDLWVMRKCGNRESWTKQFVVDTAAGPSGVPVCGQFKPLQFLGNGEILMLWRTNTLVCYDPRTKSSRCLRLHRRGDLGHTVVALTPSFVPLKDALKVDKVLTKLRLRN